MSVNKLLSRIINPNEISKRHKDPEYKVASDLHDHTFGITSDPLTQFAAVMSALIVSDLLCLLTFAISA